MLSPLSLGSVKFGAVNPAWCAVNRVTRQGRVLGREERVDVRTVFGLRADTKRE